MSQYPLILLHGSGDSPDCWAYQVTQLASPDVIALALPGHNPNWPSDQPLPETVADYAACIWNEVDRRGIEKFSVAGHSLGGAIALQMAIEQSERLSGLGLFGTGARLKVYPAALELAKTEPETALWHLMQMGWPAETDIAAIHQTIQATGHVLYPQMLYRDLLACDRFDAIAKLSQIHVPMTVIAVGNADRLTPPKYAYYLRDHIEGMQVFAERPGIGHYITLQDPETVKHLLQVFL